MKNKHAYESPELELLYLATAESFASLSEPVVSDPDEEIELPGMPL